MDNLTRTVVPSLSVHLLMGVLLEHGYDAEAILAHAGIDPKMLEGTPYLLVTGVQELAVQRGFAEATTKARELWVLASQRYNLTCWNPVGLAVATASSIERALDTMVDFSQIKYTISRLAINRIDRRCYEAEIDFPYQPGDFAEYLACRDTIIFTKLMHELSASGRFPFLSMETPTDVPMLHGFDFRIDSVAQSQDGKARWVWDAACMETRPAQANSALHAIYVERCQALADACEARDELIERIEALVASSGGDEWTLARTARALRMSTRSLQRHLSTRGLNFRTIMDDNRQRVSKRLLLESERSIAEIAWSVGYADPSCFHHAFVRWTGVTPNAFRSRTRRQVDAAARGILDAVVAPGMQHPPPRIGTEGARVQIRG